MMKKYLAVFTILAIGIFTSLELPSFLVSFSNKDVKGNDKIVKTVTQTNTNSNAVTVLEKQEIPVVEETEEKKEEQVPEEEIKEDQAPAPAAPAPAEAPVQVAIAPSKPYSEMSIEELIAAINGGSFAMQYTGIYETNANRLTKSKGVVYYENHKETYYSERVLPGGSLNIPGRHAADDGTIRDGDGYICVAANSSYLSRGAIVKTSLGPAKVYDSGCAAGTIDIYTNW